MSGVHEINLQRLMSTKYRTAVEKPSKTTETIPYRTLTLPQAGRKDENTYAKDGKVR
jgi:hypothetical protein